MLVVHNPSSFCSATEKKRGSQSDPWLERAWRAPCSTLQSLARLWRTEPPSQAETLSWEVDSPCQGPGEQNVEVEVEVDQVVTGGAWDRVGEGPS